jgi:hypothetical protein
MGCSGISHLISLKSQAKYGYNFFNKLFLKATFSKGLSSDVNDRLQPSLKLSLKRALVLSIYILGHF